MKMMSNTNVTSTSGVTLISLRDVLPVEKANAGSGEEVAFHDVQEVRAEVLHLAVEDFDLGDEVVVGDHRRYCREEAESGGDERVADRLCHRGEIGIALGVDLTGMRS